MKTKALAIIALITLTSVRGWTYDQAFIYAVSTAASDSEIIAAFQLADDKEWELLNLFGPGRADFFSDINVYKTNDNSLYYIAVPKPTYLLSPPNLDPAYTTTDAYYSISGSWFDSIALTAAFNGGSLTQSATFHTTISAQVSGTPTGHVSGYPTGRIDPSFSAEYIKNPPTVPEPSCLSLLLLVLGAGLSTRIMTRKKS